MSTTVMASLLFTDLVDSTAIGSRLGPERSEQLRQTHFGLLRSAIEASGGTEVKNLGDGLMVAFTSPSRALACATGMQQAIARHNERAKEPLAVRIGLSVGEASEEDGDYFGDPVVEAARLCGAAVGGQILTTDLVRAMVGRHAPQAFSVVGDLTLKGIPDPVATVEVLWEPLVTDGRIPLPTALAAGTRDAPFGFSGRVDELDRIGQVHKKAFGEPRLQTVLVGGEAGIGKTSVIAQFATRAHASGAAVVLGHCDEDLTVPYQPWIQALSHLVQHLGPDCVGALPPVHRDAVARLVPSLGDTSRPRGAAADSDRVVLVHAVEMLLKEISTDTPIVLVLDDLHWADAASLHVLRHLVASADEMAVLILCTYRHTDLSQDHPLTALLADLHRQPGITRIHLAGLDDVETVELLAAVAGHELDDDAVRLAHSLRRETDGNPFFTGELLRHLGESGVLHHSPDGHLVIEGDIGDAPLPAGIRDVVSQRVARLGPDASRILSLAAVIGRDFDLDILAQVSEHSEDELIDVLEAATVAAVVAETPARPGSYRFGHALIQRALYSDLGAARRARTHQRVAEALESRPIAGSTRSSELAHHWVAAVRPTDHDKALHYVIEAAAEALAALAPDDAIRWYRQALELIGGQLAPRDDLRCRLLVGLGTAQRQIGAAGYRATLVEAVTIARRIGDAELLVAAVLAADRGIAGTSAADVEWVRATEEALEMVGSADGRSRARLLALLSQSIHANDWERRRDLSNEAVAVARRIGDDATLLAILPVAYQHHGPGELDLRLADTAEAVELAAALGDVIAGCNALFHRIDACMQAADIAEVDQRIAELATHARAIALPLHLWQLSMSTSCRLLVEGRCVDAEDEANSGLEIGSAGGHSEAVLAYGAQLLEIRRQQGRLGEMVGVFGDLADDSLKSSGYRQLVGWVLSEAGRFDEADALLALDRDSGFADIPRDEGWLALMMCCASTAVALDDLDACRDLYAHLLPFERQIAAVYATTSGATARLLGCLASALGNHDHAEHHLAVALELHEQIRAPYWIACTLLDLRDVLARRDRPDDAERARLLEERAAPIARERGYLGLTARLWSGG